MKDIFVFDFNNFVVNFRFGSAVFAILILLILFLLNKYSSNMKKKKTPQSKMKA